MGQYYFPKLTSSLSGTSMNPNDAISLPHWFLNLTVHHSNWSAVKTQIAGTYPQNFWFSRSEVGPENLQF